MVYAFIRFTRCHFFGCFWTKFVTNLSPPNSPPYLLFTHTHFSSNFFSKFHSFLDACLSILKYFVRSPFALSPLCYFFKKKKKIVFWIFDKAFSRRKKNRILARAYISWKMKTSVSDGSSFQRTDAFLKRWFFFFFFFLKIFYALFVDKLLNRRIEAKNWEK